MCCKHLDCWMEMRLSHSCLIYYRTYQRMVRHWKPSSDVRITWLSLTHVEDLSRPTIRLPSLKCEDCLKTCETFQIHGHVCTAVQRLCVYRWIPLTSTSVGMAERRVRNSGSAILCSLGPSTVAPVCVASKTAVIWIR